MSWRWLPGHLDLHSQGRKNINGRRKILWRDHYDAQCPFTNNFYDTPNPCDSDMAWSRREIFGVDNSKREEETTISFGPQDLQVICLPHNDALVIYAKIANYDIRRLFVDSVSSANVIFQEALDQMDLKNHKTVRVEKKKSRRGGDNQGPGGEVSVVEEVHAIVEEEQEEATLIPGLPGKATKISRDLDLSTRTQFLKCLHRNVDVFSWSQVELVGILAYVAEHKLSTLPNARPVVQKKRHFGPEKDKIIADQVKELLKASQIREVQFPTWLSNVVLGYHQIPLAKDEQENVSLVISGGTFCYTVTPFGLKNVGATYQCLMDKIIREKARKNVEVYVDDILIKSEKTTYLISDLEETFSTSRKYGAKLNPSKCNFGFRSRKLLGFMVTEKGIEVNPEKV
ncbi:uncharacterized protein [Primulina huaijiensis]|uniref:uncharacterized protein n=1 Tax=Primulina huaijiensis TaxID=1492673 RepID=UPI003CC74341